MRGNSISRQTLTSLEIEVRPPCPYRLPSRGRMDGVMRSGGGVLTRLLHIGGAPIVVHGWQRRDGSVAIRAVAAEPDAELPPHALEEAVTRMRFSLAVDDDLTPFYKEFKRDPFIGPAIRRRPWLRAKRRPFAWEALAWAITEQLIESSRAAQIQKRIIRKWGRTSAWKGKGAEYRPLSDLPCHTTFAGMAPAELASCDLAPARSLAMVKCAKEVAAGPRRPGRPGRRRTVRAHLGDRALDSSMPRPLRPRRVRLATGRRPRLREAHRRRPRARPPRDGLRGRGVLRALRAVPRARRASSRSATTRRPRARPAACRWPRTSTRTPPRRLYSAGRRQSPPSTRSIFRADAGSGDSSPISGKRAHSSGLAQPHSLATSSHPFITLVRSRSSSTSTSFWSESDCIGAAEAVGAVHAVRSAP